MSEKHQYGTWVPANIGRMTNINCLDKLVLSTVKFLHQKGNGCYISREKMALRHGVSVDKIKRSLMALKKLGYIGMEGFNGRSRKITYLLDDTNSIASNTNRVEEDMECIIDDNGKPISRCKSAPSAGANLHHQPVQICTTSRCKSAPSAGANLHQPEQGRTISRCNGAPSAGADLHRLYIEDNLNTNLEKIKNTKKQNTKGNAATIVASHTHSSIQNAKTEDNQIPNQEVQENQPSQPMTGNERHTGKDRIRTKAETKPNACGAAASVEPPVTPAPPEQLTLVGEPEKDNAGKGKAKGRKRRGTAAISLDDFFAWLPSKQQVPAIKQLLSEFMESRQALRRPVTENAARQIIRDFAIYDDVVLGVALQRSIRAGWQGIFVPQNMANFKNEFAADINAYHRLADECRVNEDPEERRRRLLQRKEAEVREMHEGFIRKEYRELDADIARQAAEVPTWRPVMTKSHGIIGADFFRDGEWHRVFNRGCDASMLDGGDAGSHDAPAGSATSQDCATGQDCAVDGTTSALAGTPAPQQATKTDAGPTARRAEDAQEKNSFNSAVEEMYARMRAQGIDVDGILAEEAAKSREPDVFDAPMPLPLDEAIAAMEREAQTTAEAH